MAFDAHDPAIRATLKAAGDKYLAGDTQGARSRASLARAWRRRGRRRSAGGQVAGRERRCRPRTPTFARRSWAPRPRAGTPTLRNYLLGLQDKRLRSFDRIMLIGGLSGTTRKLATSPPTGFSPTTIEARQRQRHLHQQPAAEHAQQPVRRGRGGSRAALGPTV